MVATPKFGATIVRCRCRRQPHLTVAGDPSASAIALRLYAYRPRRNLYRGYSRTGDLQGEVAAAPSGAENDSRSAIKVRLYIYRLGRNLYRGDSVMCSLLYALRETSLSLN